MRSATANQVTPVQTWLGLAVLMVVMFTGTAIRVIWPDSPSWVFWLELFLILAVAAFFVYKAARYGRPAAANKMTPAQMVTGFTITMVYVLSSTAISWKWPDRSPWISNSLLVMFILLIALWAFRATRKADPPA